MHEDDGITLITCSGISKTGKLTTKTGEQRTGILVRGDFTITDDRVSQ